MGFNEISDLEFGLTFFLEFPEKVQSFIDKHKSSLTEVQLEKAERFTEIRARMKETLEEVGLTVPILEMGIDIDPEKLDPENIDPKAPNTLTAWELDAIVGVLRWPQTIMNTQIVLLKDNSDFKDLKGNLDLAINCLMGVSRAIGAKSDEPKPDHLPEPDSEKGNAPPKNVICATSIL